MCRAGFNTPADSQTRTASLPSADRIVLNYHSYPEWVAPLSTARSHEFATMRPLLNRALISGANFLAARGRARLNLAHIGRSPSASRTRGWASLCLHRQTAPGWTPRTSPSMRPARHWASTPSPDAAGRREQGAGCDVKREGCGLEKGSAPYPELSAVKQGKCAKEVVGERGFLVARRCDHVTSCRWGGGGAAFACDSGRRSRRGEELLVFHAPG
jgi:hypothetical protein